jgi:hypothetical protein
MSIAISLFHKWFHSSCPNKIKLPVVIIFALLIFLPFASSSGKVFWGRLLAQGRSIFDPAGAWRQIYKAPLTINGARAIMTVHGCNESLAILKARLKQNFGSSEKNCFIEADSSFWMFGAVDNRISRLLALALPDPDKSLVFTIDQSPSEFSKSTNIPSESILPDYPLFTGGRLETAIKNEETGTALETMTADAAPDIVLSEVSANLSQQGWKQLYPEVRRRSESYGGQVPGPGPAANSGGQERRFLVFQRGEAVCTLLAGPALHENKTCVTILLKEKTEK